MHNRVPSKGLSKMDRAVPKNDKFSGVQGKLDTGLTMNKVKVLTARQYAKRRDEIFFRLAPKQMAELFDEYENPEEEHIRDADNHHGSGPTIVTYSEQEGAVYENPYLLVDVRDADQFQICHLTQARSFPFAYMKRDQAIRDFHSFKNKEGYLIILYCDDERISREAAKLLVDRGTDNIFLLTGGLAEFAPEYPHYVEGVSPFSPKKPAKNGGLSRISEHKGHAGDGSPASYSSSRGGRGAHPPLTTQNLQRKQMADVRSGCSGSGSSNRDNYSVASTGTNRSVADSVISRSTARKGKF